MNPVPKHVAIIMDGNGRWAKAKGLPRIAGHREGVETSDKIVTAAQDAGVKYLTLYAFSDENWNRPDEEVAALMELLVEYLRLKQPKMIANGVRLRAIGEIERLPAHVSESLLKTQDVTAGCNAMTLILALSYGSRNEICRAVERCMRDNVGSVTPEVISARLDTAQYPDPDLLIRTSGECRISNFLLWQLAYTEFYFTETLWPDFTAGEFNEAIASYRRRERRFGRVVGE